MKKTKNTKKKSTISKARTAGKARGRLGSPKIRHASALPKKTAARKRKIFRNSELLSNAHMRQHLIGLAGENAVNVIKEFGFEISDEDLARKSKTKLSDVRAVLNRLHTTGLVEYTRNRDPDSGWYSYVWRVNDKVVDKLLEQHSANTPQQNGAEAQEQQEKYYCKDCGDDTIIDFENAFEMKFKCPSCGKSMIYQE